MKKAILIVCIKNKQFLAIVGKMYLALSESIENESKKRYFELNLLIMENHTKTNIFKGIILDHGS